ncbi:hypothetical protein [Methylophilus sp. DW102]|uniref:hypothetical protein n=1 Tax=Methylophilus sp. DW102 TaxID=3095607 RepID=UPI00308AD0C0|nr:hypothetical protein MTDW_12770 [Methylophilus sp. DW102]BEV09316.1 hypothetical protein MTDW_26160 [Methylophilus sp. DW102]
MQSQIDPELPEETSGPNIGKILVSRLRQALGFARDESTAHGNAIEELTEALANKLDSSDATGFATAAQGLKADNAVQPSELMQFDNSIPGKVRSAILTGIEFTVNAAITAADSVLVALGKLQKQITDHLADSKGHLNAMQKGNSNIAGTAGLSASGSLIALDGSDTGAMTLKELKKAFDAGRFFGPPRALLASRNNRPNTSRRQMTYTPSGQPTSGKRRMLTYQYHVIGSGDRKTLQVIIDNFFFDGNATGGQGVATGNAITVCSVSAQIAVANSPIINFTKGGLSTWTVANGEKESITDEMLGNFPNGTAYMVRVEIEVDYNQYVPCMEVADTSNALTATLYDPAINTWNKNSTSYQWGPSWSTGTAGNTTNVIGMGVQLVGKFADSVVGEPMVLCGFFDSIGQNGHDGTGQTSYFYRLLQQYGIAGGSVGRIGGQSDIVTANAYGTYLVKYSNCGMEEFGTNTVSGTETLAQLQARCLATWAAIRAAVLPAPKNNPYFLFRTYLLLNTNSGNTAPASAKWNAGGMVELFNAWLETVKGTPTGPDYVIDPSIGSGGSLRKSTSGKGTLNSDYYLWGAGLTLEGLHVASPGATIAAANVNAQLPSYS